MPIHNKPNFDPLDKDSQMTLDLELLKIETEDIGPEEAHRRAEIGRSALFRLKETPQELPTWFNLFESLIVGGWPWRQACYIAWASTPKDGRWPETQDELAKQVMNLGSDRAISTWRKKNSAIDDMVHILSTAEFWENRAGYFDSVKEGALKAGSDYKYFLYLKLALEMTGDYVPLSQLKAFIQRKSDGGPHSMEEEKLDDLSKEGQKLGAEFDNSMPESAVDGG